MIISKYLLKKRNYNQLTEFNYTHTHIFKFKYNDTHNDSYTLPSTFSPWYSIVSRSFLQMLLFGLLYSITTMSVDIYITPKQYICIQIGITNVLYLMCPR